MDVAIAVHKVPTHHDENEHRPPLIFFDEHVTAVRYRLAQVNLECFRIGGVTRQ